MKLNHATAIVRLYFQKEITFDFFVENRPIGDYESYFRKQPTQFYVQAIEPSEILILNDVCLGLLFEEPSNGQRLQRIVVENLFFRFRDKLLYLYLDEPEERYRNLLQKLLSQFYSALQHVLMGRKFGGGFKGSGKMIRTKSNHGCNIA
jgi:hypothetical protein